ncbi:hypothetical protein CN470_24915 [Bacillus cereus]|uniref:hypothetical protein n=1 Tax=Bacillus cereus TaxID=1396 RepID=UPI000BF7E50F|nr:hypothetical protein [Bacillus cereus]PEQ58431.1 hypothetical protein CN470_24915 [Bacillus cereus]PFS95077.1 hypothetical protein COK58_18520 [Bacillus cereus]
MDLIGSFAQQSNRLQYEKKIRNKFLISHHLFLLKIPFSVTKRLIIVQLHYDRLSIIDGILQYRYCAFQ